MFKRRIFASFMATLGCLLVSAPALADDPGINPGVKLGSWLYNNVTALFAPILAAVAIYYLVKRQFTKFLAFGIFAALAAFLIFGASDFKDIAVSFTKWAFGK